MSASEPDDAPADDAPEPRGPEGGPFSLGALRELVKLMEQHGLTEVSLKSGETHWRLRRGPEAGPGSGVSAGYSPPVAPPPAPPAPPPAAESSGAAASAAGGVFIKSPTVGTFYSATSPDDPPFVTAGSRVQPDTVVCLIEAMKVFNQIPAEVSGVIAEVLARNGDSVEFGQPLFRVTPG